MRIKRTKPDLQTLRNHLLVEIIKEKGNTVFISEKSEIATTFYEELKFRHDQRDRAEQAFRNTIECLLKHHDKKVKQYVKHLKMIVSSLLYKIVINTGQDLQLNTIERYTIH